MPTRKHEINEFPGSATQEWLSNELEKAESSLTKVIGSLQADAEPETDHHSMTRTDTDAIDCTADIKSSTKNGKKSNISSLSNEVHVISLAKAYLDVVQNAAEAASDEEELLFYLESQLKYILQSYHNFLSAASTEFCSLYDEICRRHVSIQRRIQAKAVLHVRRTLRQHAYPSSQALERILSVLDTESVSTDSELKADIETLRKIDCKILAKEFVNPIVQRVKHHFLTSRTIPQDKLLKIPHLLIAYLRKVIPHAAPIIGKIECELLFYQQINDLIQHILFQRGYFEKMSTASPVALTILIQDIMKYDAFVQDQMIQKEHTSETPTLTEQIICKNKQLFQWWVQAQRNYALHALDESGTKAGPDAIKSTAEILQSLLYSQQVKIALLKRNLYKSICFEQIVIPTCMKYLDLLHKRATTIRSAIDTSTIYNLPSNIVEWLMLIEQTSQTARKLNSFDSSELSSLSESFEKFSIAMVEDCANSYVNLLMERSTLSSFLMTAGHLLSYGGNDAIHNGMEDVYMILNVWNNESLSALHGIDPSRKQIVGKVCNFLEQQLLEVVLDDLLEITSDGCQSFSDIVLEMIRVLQKADDVPSCRRVYDICRFLPEAHKIRQIVFSIMEKDEGDKVDYFELEQDGTLFSTVEDMIRSKGFAFMGMEDAISLMNRCTER